LKRDDEYSVEIITFYIGFSNEYIENYFDSKILSNMGVVECRIPEDNTDITKERYIIETAEIKKMCEDGEAKYFEINNDYSLEVQKIYDWVDEQVEKLRIK